MKVELKNIKHAAFASEETNCFQATLYINGKNRGTVSNDGHGGSDNFSDWEASKELDAWGKTQPQTSYEMGGETHMMTVDAESIVGDLLQNWLLSRDLTRAMKRKILFTRSDKPGIFETKGVKPEQIKVLLSNVPKYFPHAAKVLNLLPFDEALAIYSEGA